MSNFVDKATSKISKLSQEQISRIINTQNEDLTIRNLVLDSISDGLLLIDFDQKITYSNKYAMLFLPINSKYDKLVGRKVKDVISDEEIVSFIQDCITKKVNDAEFMYHHSSSMFGEMDLRILSKTTANQILFSIHDFTFINKVKDQFRKNESLAAMTTMAAQVAHEIKNPLASMSIYVQLLEKKLNSKGSVTKEEAEGTIKVLSEEIERLNQIAVDFLFAVKPMKVKLEMLNINDIIKSTMTLVDPEANSVNVKIEVSLATTMPKLRIDSSLIEQSLLNLIRNSIQAIGQDAKDGKIEIRSYVDGDCVKVEVTDNGCGMSDEQMSKIFEPYYTTKASGTGLGLTTIFKIMKELGGEISVNSELGKGSTFTIILPIPSSERFKLEHSK